MSGSIRSRIGGAIVAAAFAIVVVAVAVTPFLNPVWVGFEQDRSGAGATTGYTSAELRTATDAILADLLFGPPAFDVTVDGQPVLNARERSHMADVRSVFAAFATVAFVAAGVVVLGWLAATRVGGTWFWRGIRWGSAALALGVVVVGVVGALAFDAAFDVFHRLFFAGGTYTFDPRTDRLVQLFPERFWFETSLGIGVVILGISLAAWSLAGRRVQPVRVEMPASARRAEAVR